MNQNFKSFKHNFFFDQTSIATVCRMEGKRLATYLRGWNSSTSIHIVEFNGQFWFNFAAFVIDNLLAMRSDENLAKYSTYL